MLTTKWASPRNFDKGTSFPLKGSVTSKSFAGAGFVVASGGAAGRRGDATAGAAAAGASASERLLGDETSARTGAPAQRRAAIKGQAGGELAASATTANIARVWCAMDANDKSVPKVNYTATRSF